MIKKLMLKLMVAVILIGSTISVLPNHVSAAGNLRSIVTKGIEIIPYSPKKDLVTEEEKAKQYSDYKNTIKVVSIAVSYSVDSSTNLKIGSGTGFMLPNGYIVTANHVAPKTYKNSENLIYDISFYSQKIVSMSIKASLVATDVNHDTSILKVNVSEIPVEYKDSYFKDFDYSYDNNEKVKAIGHPYKPLHYDNSDKIKMPSDVLYIMPTHMSYMWETAYGSIAYSSIIVNRKNYDSPPCDVMQLKLQSYPGNSGSPVINEEGQLVGMIFAIISGTDSSFAFRSKDIMDIIEQNNLKDIIFK